MSRRDRQRAELDALCRAGSMEHALDLAFSHVADFGRDEDLFAMLRKALEHDTEATTLRRRLADLEARR